MRVLLLNQTFYPDRAATAQQLTDTAAYLVEKGHEVTVVTCRLGYEDKSLVFRSEEVHRGVKIYRVGSTSFGKRSFFHRFIDGVTFEVAALIRLFSLPRQDVVISLTSPPLIGVVGTVISKFWKARSIQWLMDINPDIAIAVGYLRKESMASRFLTAALDFTLKNADGVIVLDSWMERVAVSHGANPNFVHIIPPWPAQGFSIMGKKSPPTENAFREELGLSGKFVVLYSGNLSIVHPVQTVLDAALSTASDPEIQYVFIGGGLREDEVKSFKEKHGLTNLTFLPWQPKERLNETLTFANAHLVIMGDEVNGLVHTSKIYGVLSTGRPYIFVGPEDCHISDLISKYPYGYRVAHGDVEGFVGAIKKIQELSGRQLTEFAEGNIGFIEKNYSSFQSLEKLEREVICDEKPQDNSDFARQAI